MKAVVFPQRIAPFSTTRYLQAALRELGVEVLDGVNEVGPGVDVLGAVLVQPTDLPRGLKWPVVTVFNDRLSRMPADWVASFCAGSLAVFSLNLPEALPWPTASPPAQWAPGAYDPRVHALIPSKTDFDRRGIGYLGTFNSWRKYRFLRHLNDKLGVVIFGNAWEFAPPDIQRAIAGPPAYNSEYPPMLARFSLVVNVAESRWGPNRKTFEIPHQALMLTERVPGTTEVFTGLEDRPWWFSTPKELVQAARFYADNPGQIVGHRREQVAKVAPFTYESQARIILKALRGETL